MMACYFNVIIFVFGLMIGSFLNCVIYRLEEGGSSLKGRSFCPHCRHILSWQDLIPVLSFLILRGRCRYCQKQISLQYPFVELATGILLLLLFENLFPIIDIWEIGFLFIVSCFLVVIFVYDFKHYIIPDKVIYPAIIIAAIFNFQFLIFNEFSIFNSSIFSALGAAAFFAAIVLISRGKWMGEGDIKLAFLMGLILGFPGIAAALFLSFFIGSAVGIGLIAARKKKLKSEVPFGPFLVAGTFIALFWSDKLINWYLNLILIK